MFWNVYGLGNEGKINYSDGSWNFYLKDHLGSVRCVIDGNGDIISAEDLDMWGYRMTDRSFQSDTTFYKYTGKERDVTTGYDYFGARYYDSRIGRWGQVEPLLEKYFSLSPYVYANNNPVSYVDLRGLDYYFYMEGSSEPIIFRKPGRHRYFFEHSKGNLEATSTDDKINEFFSGKSFFEGHSKRTVDDYFEANEKYESSNVDLDFDKKGFYERYNDAIPSWYNPVPGRLYALRESQPGGSMDQKTRLEKNMLYYFNGLLFNQQEAGNIVWGAVMAHLRISLGEAILGANLFSLYANQRLDELNEQAAFTKGYFAFYQRKMLPRIFP